MGLNVTLMTSNAAPEPQCVLCKSDDTDDSVPVAPGVMKQPFRLPYPLLLDMEVADPVEEGVNLGLLDEYAVPGSSAIYYDGYETYPVEAGSMICDTCLNKYAEVDLGFCIECTLPLNEGRDSSPFAVWTDTRSGNRPAFSCADCVTLNTPGSRPDAVAVEELEWDVIEGGGAGDEYFAGLYYRGNNAAGRPWFKVEIMNYETDDSVEIPHHVLEDLVLCLLPLSVPIKWRSRGWQYELLRIDDGINVDQPEPFFVLGGTECEEELVVPNSVIQHMLATITALTPALSDPDFPTAAFLTFIEDGMSGIDALAAVNFTHSCDTK